MELCKLNFVEFKLSSIVAVNDTVSLLYRLLLAVQLPMRRRFAPPRPAFLSHRRSDGASMRIRRGFRWNQRLGLLGSWDSKRKEE
nr:hypothetical protein CFP56_49293 [Quercus suber]